MHLNIFRRKFETGNLTLWRALLICGPWTVPQWHLRFLKSPHREKPKAKSPDKGTMVRVNVLACVARGTGNPSKLSGLSSWPLGILPAWPHLRKASWSPSALTPAAMWAASLSAGTEQGSTAEGQLIFPQDVPPQGSRTLPHHGTPLRIARVQYVCLGRLPVDSGVFTAYPGIKAQCCFKNALCSLPWKSTLICP